MKEKELYQALSKAQEDLFQLMEEKAIAKRSINKLHEDKNIRNIRFDIYDLKRLEGELDVIMDEIEAKEMEVKSIESKIKSI